MVMQIWRKMMGNNLKNYILFGLIIGVIICCGIGINQKYGIILALIIASLGTVIGLIISEIQK